jgi:DNA ligase (NAD+)
MNKKKIESDYKKKINLLTSYNKNYYDASKPLVSDKVYDDLKNSILILERNILFSIQKNHHQKLLDLNHLKTSKSIS